MKTISFILFLLFSCYFASSFEIKDDVPTLCGTDIVWKIRQNLTNHKSPADAATCQPVTSCDIPSIRNQHSNRQGTKVRILIHVVDYVNGTSSGTNNNEIISQVNKVKRDYAQMGIDFDFDPSTDIMHYKGFKFNGQSLSCLAQYSSFSNKWFNQLEALKTQFSINPSYNLNVFVSCQDPSSQGTLLGIGTFPWDSTALTATGGLWVNSISMNPSSMTMSHELGHNFGLWHSFHGTTRELPSCSDACMENVHTYNDPSADLVGDFCADTLAQPLNYNTYPKCALPAGRDCDFVTYSDAKYVPDSEYLVNNFMSYCADGCVSDFTPCQAARANCYLCLEISSQTTGCL